MSQLPSPSQFALEVIHNPGLRRVVDSPIDAILDPLYAAAKDSSSLVASQHPVNANGESFDISKFLLLGQRGGGRPICLGLFAGFESGSLETVRALAQLLLQLKNGRSLTRDYAFFGYPVVNVRSFATKPSPAGELAGESPDVQYFKTELQKWRFDGLLSFHVDAGTRGYYATVGSELIAAEVVEPALAAASEALPLATQAVKVHAHGDFAHTAGYTRLTPPSGTRPLPFEIELYFPHEPITEQRIDGLFVALTEILRLYRAFIAHGKDL